MLAETDLALINALQVSPRADWAQIGKALGVTASTAARRWAALSATGRAWVTSAPGVRFSSVTSFLRVTAAPGAHAAVAEQLCAEPSAATVSMVSGRFDFLVDCFAPSPEALSALLIDRYAAMPGVQHAASSVAAAIHRGGSEYRSGALDAEQTRLVGDGQAGKTGFDLSPDATDHALLRGLCLDGRASWAELATVSGVSPQTARRRVGALQASGYLSLRCDYCDDARGPLREVSLMLDVPGPAMEQVAGYFARLKECRLTAQVVDSFNLLTTLWVRDLTEIDRHEREMAKLAAGVHVVDRHVVLRTIKRVGHVLDRDGCSAQVVPPAVWSD